MSKRCTRASIFSFAFALATLASVACGNTPPRPTPQISTEPFEGPGDALTAAEVAAFDKAIESIQPQMTDCIEKSYYRGVRSSELVVRMRFQRDGRITAIGFKSAEKDEAVVDFLQCVRAAMLDMDLSKGPWEKDHKIVHRHTTVMRTTTE